MKHTFLFACVLLIACGPGGRSGTGGGGDDDGSSTCPVCSDDKMSVIDCNGNVPACPPEQACSNGACMQACEAAEQNHASIGCDYYGVDMDAAQGPPQDACYTVFIANTSQGQAHMNIEWNGSFSDLAT